MFSSLAGKRGSNSTSTPTFVAGGSAPLTAQEKYQQANVKARVFVQDSGGRITKKTEEMTAIANSSYWYYGYFGSAAATTMGMCLAIGSRFPMMRSYAGWVALVGGYAGGSACHGLHSNYKKMDLVRLMDHELAETKKLDELENFTIPDYQEYYDKLKMMKFSLVPNDPEALASAHQEENLDDRVDRLVEEFHRKKEALRKK